jgi:hypothetical protein
MIWDGIDQLAIERLGFIEPAGLVMLHRPTEIRDQFDQLRSDLGAGLTLKQLAIQSVGLIEPAGLLMRHRGPQI